MTITLNKLLNKIGIAPSKSINDTIYTFFVRASGIVIGTLISIFLGRTLGAKGLGIISLTNQIIGILLMFSLLGIPTVVVKEVSIAFSRKDWSHANSVIATSLKINSVWGIALIIAGYFFIPYAVTNIFQEPLLELPLKIALFAMLFQIFTSIFTSAINGYRKIWQSSLGNNTASLFIVIILLLFQYFLNYHITVVMVIWDYAISRVFVTIILGIYWKIIHHSSNNKKFIHKPILKVALPLLFAQATSIIANSADVIMIGWLMSAKDVGLYSVAAKIAIISTIFLQVTNAVIAPKVAAMYAENKIKEIEKVVQRVTKYLTIIGIAIFMLIIMTGQFVLLIWGEEFRVSYFALIILSFGNFINVSSGALGLILTMCGQERIFSIIIFFTAIINIVLNYSLIPSIGVNGAAMATAVTLITGNLLGAYFVKKKVNISIIKLS